VSNIIGPPLPWQSKIEDEEFWRCHRLVEARHAAIIRSRQTEVNENSSNITTSKTTLLQKLAGYVRSVSSFRVTEDQEPSKTMDLKIASARELSINQLFIRETNTHTGSRVWDTSLAMLQWMFERQDLFRGKTALVCISIITLLSAPN
jgi:hypothetical protein